MKPIDILLIAGLAALVIGIVANLVVKKKQGKTGCGCSCKGCPSAGACSGARSSESPEGGTHV